MQPVSVFPDAELVVVEYLRDALAATVATKVPNPRPSPLVVVRRVGGSRLNQVADDALLVVESWAVDPAVAQGLSQQARALIHAMRGSTVDGVAIYRVAEAAGPAALPDPLSDEPRYTFTVSVAMRGSAFELEPVGGGLFPALDVFPGADLFPEAS